MVCLPLSLRERDVRSRVSTLTTGTGCSSSSSEMSAQSCSFVARDEEGVGAVAMVSERGDERI